MASLTTNLQLTKPELSDNINPAIFANNFDKIDDAYAETKTACSELSTSLTANNNQFVFDYQDGKYGFNTNPNRGADTFHPFKSGIKIEFIQRVNNPSGSSAVINIAEKIDNYAELTKDNIFIVPISVSGAMNIADNKVGHSTSGTTVISYSYDPSTGNIAVNGLIGRSAIYGNTACSYWLSNFDVYVVQ